MQELGAWSDDFELGGCTVHVKTNGSAAVVVPNELESAGTLDSRLEHRWALVRVGEMVLGSVHLPPVKSTSSVQEAEDIMESMSEVIGEWKREKRPPKHILVSIDANVPLQASIEKITGGWVWRESGSSSKKLGRTSSLVLSTHFC